MMCQYGAWISTCFPSSPMLTKQNDPAAAEGVLNVLAPLGLTSAIPAV